jgi:hypothetical protein
MGRNTKPTGEAGHLPTNRKSYPHSLQAGSPAIYSNFSARAMATGFKGKLAVGTLKTVKSARLKKEDERLRKSLLKRVKDMTKGDLIARERREAFGKKPSVFAGGIVNIQASIEDVKKIHAQRERARSKAKQKMMKVQGQRKMILRYARHPEQWNVDVVMHGNQHGLWRTGDTDMSAVGMSDINATMRSHDSVYAAEHDMKKSTRVVDQSFCSSWVPNDQKPHWHDVKPTGCETMTGSFQDILVGHAEGLEPHVDETGFTAQKPTGKVGSDRAWTSLKRQRTLQKHLQDVIAKLKSELKVMPGATDIDMSFLSQRQARALVMKDMAEFQAELKDVTCVIEKHTEMQGLRKSRRLEEESKRSVCWQDAEASGKHRLARYYQKCGRPIGDEGSIASNNSFAMTNWDNDQWRRAGGSPPPKGAWGVGGEEESGGEEMDGSWAEEVNGVMMSQSMSALTPMSPGSNAGSLSKSTSHDENMKSRLGWQANHALERWSSKPPMRAASATTAY